MSIVHTSYVPYEPSVHQYCRWTGDINILMPWQYNGWQAETFAWKNSAYLSANLSGTMPDQLIKGPDAERLMSENFVNGFTLDKFPVGKGKHIVGVSPKGNVISHGLGLRTAEDEFHVYSVVPFVMMLTNNGEYDVEPQTYDHTKDFVYQIAGPRSLEIVEHTIEEDIHDLKFMEFRNKKAEGADVRVIRMGMGGTISYEIHGAREDAEKVYNKIVKAGQNYGLERMGTLAYMCNHTENGFPQYGTHFIRAIQEYPKMYRFMGYTEETKWEVDKAYELHGSMNDMGVSAYYANPIELGWSNIINWKHDFVGKDALQKIKEDPARRSVCTLVWNEEDILNIFRAIYDKKDKSMPDIMYYPQNYYHAADGNLSDKVFDKDGKLIGRSAGIVYTQYYKYTISLGLIDLDKNVQGDEVTVLWGSNGTRQIPIRARIERYPYLDLTSNRDYDMESIPHYHK